MIGLAERKFEDEIKVTEAIEEMEKTIDGRWVQKNAVMAGGVPDAPIIAEQIGQKIPFPTTSGCAYERKCDASTESLMDCMKNTKLVIMYPGDNDEQVYPVSIYGLDAMVARAGYSGSPVLTATAPKKGVKEMPSATKAMILNEAFPLYAGDDKDQTNPTSNKVFVFRCDEQIDYVGSSNYVYVAISEANAAVKEALAEIFPKFTFREATLSREFASFTYNLNDASLKKQLESAFLQCGLNIHDYDPVLKFTTSNIGISGMNLYPLLVNGRTQMEIELPIKLEHRGDASVEKLKENVRKILMLFRLTPQKINELDDFEIEYPEQAMKNISQAAGLPQKTFFERAEGFGEEYTSPTALDLYFAICDALGEYTAKETISAFNNMNYMERVCRIFFGGALDKYDIPGTVSPVNFKTRGVA